RASARNQELLEELAAEARNAGHSLEVVKADVATAEGRDAMVRAAKEKFGGLDVLVNNAGIGATGHFADSSPEVLRSIMETNFFGTVETTRAFLPHLREGNTPAVVDVCSILGRRALAGPGVSSARKV